MSKGLVKVVIAIIIGFFIIKACTGRNDNYQRVAYEKTELDKLVQKHSTEPDYSIVLYDMDAEGTGSSTIYKHKYQVIIPKSDTVESYTTDWRTVSDIFFEQHVDHLGMELAHKKDGKLHKETAPAGYSHFVGNERYGQWRERNGNSFWEFYGKYAFMSSMFNMMTYPVRRSYYNDYYTGYYGTGRTYYGPRGTYYGTRSYTNSTAGKNRTWSSKPSSFKNDVRSRVSRSAERTRASRVSRSSSRSGSSYRSRSGGFGK
jgi:hypothetical protein